METKNGVSFFYPCIKKETCSCIKLSFAFVIVHLLFHLLLGGAFLPHITSVVVFIRYRMLKFVTRKNGTLQLKKEKPKKMYDACFHMLVKGFIACCLWPIVGFDLCRVSCNLTCGTRHYIHQC